MLAIHLEYEELFSQLEYSDILLCPKHLHMVGLLSHLCCRQVTATQLGNEHQYIWYHMTEQTAEIWFCSLSNFLSAYKMHFISIMVFNILFKPYSTSLLNQKHGSHCQPKCCAMCASMWVCVNLCVLVHSAFGGIVNPFITDCSKQNRVIIWDTFHNSCYKLTFLRLTWSFSKRNNWCGCITVEFDGGSG